jgi:Ni/Co efflux regulator RcnB
MKKLMIATVAAATALSPVLTSTALAYPGEYERHDRGDWGDRRGDRDDYRRGDRDDRGRDFRRDNGRHNGFWYNGRFYRGEPSRAQRSGRDFRYGYRQWRRGERLGVYERAHYRRVADYRAYRLAPPPRGYEYRRSDTGEFILAAVATGVILSIILNASQ